MAGAAEATRVGEIVEAAVASDGLVLERVTVTPAGKRRLVRVVVDLPDHEIGSLSLDQLAEASRAVNAAMDAADPFGTAPYVLEVTSPGVNRPLTERRHWLRARTRMVKVKIDGTAVTGRLQEVDDDGIVLHLDDADEADPRERRAGWDHVGTGHVQVEFSRSEAEVED